MPETPLAIEAARQYAEEISTYTYFATGLAIPFVIGGRRGLLTLVSTAASSRLANQNADEYERMLPVLNPHWLLYEMHWHEGLVLGNWHGITDPRYQGRQLPGVFGDFLGE